MDPDNPVGRLFLAVPLTEEARHALAAFLDEALGGKPVPGRPVPPENWHFTLRFLGQTTQLEFERVTAAVAGAALGARFQLRLDSLGAFPRPARATVLWAGVSEGGQRLAELSGLAEEAARSAGFADEDRPFHGHLTLSRIRPHQDVRSVIEAVPPVPIGWTVPEVVLYRSQLGGGKPARYEPLETFPLR